MLQLCSLTNSIDICIIFLLLFLLKGIPNLEKNIINTIKLPR